MRIERIVPGHPEQNGTHERMHRTLKTETARRRSRQWSVSRSAPTSSGVGDIMTFVTKNADTLLEEALQLTPSERAKLAAELLSSLEDRDEDVKAAWAAEIVRRAADAETDPDDEEDWRTALDDIRREVLSH